VNPHIDPTLFAAPDLSFATLPSGVVLPYLERGAGEPLLFVHGSLCDYRYWAPQMEPLAQQFRCIVPSLSHYWPALDACISSGIRAAAISRISSRAAIRASCARSCSPTRAARSC
jgi:pimeloyl-ACP methyl ester carboxylesterase